MSVEKYGWAIQKTYLDGPIKFLHFLTPAIMFNITSKYFSFFNNKSPAS